MRERMRLFWAAVLAFLVAGIPAMWAYVPSAQGAGSYPDIMLAAFWNSDEDLSDTVYMSYNGSDFQKLSTAYQAVGHGDDTVANVPSYVHALHDPGLFYRAGTFWMLSGFVQKQEGIGWRYTPMFGSSKDLVHWSYPNSGSPTNLKPTVMPAGAAKLPDGQYDTAGTDGFVDDNGDVYVVTTLGYFGSKHGHPQKDQMSPYIVKVKNLEPGADPAVDPGKQPNLSYGDLMPINLPIKANDWLDPSIYKENGRYYLSIKKEGVTNQIFSIRNLKDVQDPSAWTVVNKDVVTGYEGPYLAKYKGTYYYYVDKLKDWPPHNYDGTAGVFVMQSDKLSANWSTPRRITTMDVKGNIIPNRHGSVFTVTNPNAKNVIWRLRESLGYGLYRPGIKGWITENGEKYWYDDGIRAVSKEVYDPTSQAWYWIDANGTMAHDKDVYIANASKWVRYDSAGHMIKGEDFRYGGWYWFDPTSGAMQKGIMTIPTKTPIDETDDGAPADSPLRAPKPTPEPNAPNTPNTPNTDKNNTGNGSTSSTGSTGNSGTTEKPNTQKPEVEQHPDALNPKATTKTVYYDRRTGQMVHGEAFLTEPGYYGWHLFDYGTGAMRKGLQYIAGANKWVYYSPKNGAMQYGEHLINDGKHNTGWYLFQQRTGAMFFGDTFVRSNGGKWVRYDRRTGTMVHGLQWQDGAWYYFDPTTGAMAHGHTWVPDWNDWHDFDEVTGRG